MTAKPKKAMVLAAGEGQRMRPLTDDCPKPLLHVGGKPMIDHALEALAAAGIEQAVVNLFHHADMLASHLEKFETPEILLSRENERLETGGGTKQALGLLGADPFYVLNADMVWLDSEEPALERLAQAWDPEKMDVLLLLQPVHKTGEEAAPGDYFMEKNGKLCRRRDKSEAPYMFTGIRIVNPSVFDGSPDGSFSFLELFDKAEEQGRLFGLEHDSGWFHIGDPAALKSADRLLGALAVRRMMEGL